MTTPWRSTVSLFGAVLVLSSLTTLTHQDIASQNIIPANQTEYASPTTMPHDQTEWSSLDSTLKIIVDPDNDKANDSKACHPKPGGENSTVPCKTLDYAFEQFHSLNSVVFYLASSNSRYALHNNTTFRNVNGVSIIGNSSSNESVVIQCDPLAGLSFLNSSSIKLSYVRFVECGALQNSTSRDFTKHRLRMLMINVSLYFYMCNDVIMDHVDVINSSHATGVVMYDTNGMIEVSSCLFYNNTAAYEGIPGGGAFTVEFTYCSPGDTSCSPKFEFYDPSYRARNLPAQYVFSDCCFELNVAKGPSFTNYAGNVIFASLANHTGVGRGGGLSIYFKGVAVNKSVNITGCDFIRNNAVWGGGLLIEMDDNTMSNKIFISECNFTKNHAFFHDNSGTGGGGIRVATTVYFWNDTYKEKNYTQSEILVEHSNFTSNKAIEGGAISFSIARQTSSYFSQLTYLFVSDCSFNDNRAQLGAAVTAIVYPIFNTGFIPSLTVRDCQFTGNIIANHFNESKFDPLKSHPSGMGTVYVNKVWVIFGGSIAFYNNIGTALAVVGAQVDFSRTGSATRFFENSGTSGGAIALLGASSILTGPHTVMYFDSNYASIHGGAIYNRYITKEDFSSSVDCFFRYSDPFVGPFQWENVHIIFNDNKAKKAGNSIYSTSILPCSWGEPLTGQFNSIFCRSHTWHFNNSDCIAEIYSEPMKMQLRNSSEIEIFSGHEFILPLDAFDDFGHNVTKDAVYAADVDSPNAAVEPSFSYVANNYVGLTGKPGTNVSMSMYTAGSRTTYVSVLLTILNCPPGFIPAHTDYANSSDIYDPDTESDYALWLNTDDGLDYDNANSSKYISCVCPTDVDPKNVTFLGNLRCLYHELHSQIHHRYWIGNYSENSTELVMGLVPQYYTTSALYGDEFIDLPHHLNSTNEVICGGSHRTGVLCGQCLQGYGVAINSPKFPCVLCNTTTSTKVGLVFAYIALTYVPILFLFFAIILFNFKLTSSAALSFVLYAQMMGSGVFSLSAGEAMYLNESSIARMETAYTTVYGIFNLNSLSFLMKPFCVSEHLTTLDVISLEYTIAAFPLITIALIYIGYRCKILKCHCMTRRSRRLRGVEPSSTSTLHSMDGPQESKIRPPKNTLIHAFVAFLFLSYTKFSLASMFTMSITELFYATGDSYRSNVIYFAGHLQFTDYRYLVPYGIIAIFILVFIVILPPLLLLGPIQFIDWLIDKRGFTCLQKIWPSIKVHTFLDTFQGFYKPNRRFFSGVYFLFRLAVFVDYSFSKTIVSQYVFQQIAVMVLIVLVALLKPYTRDFYNYLDVLILFNLGTINALAIYIFTNRSMSSSFPYKLYVFEYILVWLPLVYMICYAVWNRVHKRQWYQTAKERLIQIFYPARHFLDSGTSRERQHLLNRPSEKSLEDSVNFTSEDPDEGLFRRAKRKNRYSKTGIQGRVPTTIVSVGEEDEEDWVKRDSGTSTGGSSRSDMHSNDS